MTREITLTRGFVAIVDDEDFDTLSMHRWHASGSHTVYAARMVDRKFIYMHREVVKAPKGVPVDHANRLTLDNRRANLRPCTVSQNVANRVLRSRSGFRGAYAHRRRWRAQIKVDGSMVRLGSFETPHEAALAYDEAAFAHFGEFAVLNFPRPAHLFAPLGREEDR